MLSISRRQLERIFKSGYGTSPKTFQRIIRFRNAYEAFYQISTAPDWQDISHYYGYSDQAHFIREFKEFAAEVPSSVYQYDQQYFRRHDKPVVINQS